MKRIKNRSDKIKSFTEIFIVVVLFILFSYLTQKNLETIKLFIGNGMFGMFFYVIIVVIAVVVAPISAMPLLPIASSLWGWFLAAVLSIIGWTIGALIAFVIARKYGLPIVKRFISIEKINHFENIIPQQNIFWSIVFFRMVIPVDILSYALGLFSQISGWKYFLATIIGVSPFAFFFSFFGKMPIFYQIIALLIALLIFFIGLGLRIKYEKKAKKKVVVRMKSKKSLKASLLRWKSDHG